MQVRHAQGGTPFSGIVFLKGLLLLVLAAAVYQRSASKGFSFLGFFPLLWLSVSSFQWDLCAAPQHPYWLWLVLFLAVESLVLWIGDGKRLFLLLAPLWGLMVWLFAFSLLFPLTFFDVPRVRAICSAAIRGFTRATASSFSAPFLRSFLPVFAAGVLCFLGGFLVWSFPLFLLVLVFFVSPESRFKRSAWAIRGGLGAGLGFFLLFKGWGSYGFEWESLYGLLIDQRYIAFFLLGWLGMMAFSRQGTARYAVFPMFLLLLGHLFWGSGSLSTPLGVGLLKWTLVFFAGFGWESFRRDLMDPTWHGRTVWFVLGAALFGGVV